jgi:hypothetical protein
MFCLSVANADEVTAKIISCGIFTVPNKHRIQEVPEAFSGTVRIYKGLPTLEIATNQIPAKIGTDFGFIYKISNLPLKDGEEVELVKAVNNPGIKKPDGKTSQTSEWKLKKVVMDGCVVDYSGFGFDYDYELVPGVWKFEIKYKGKAVCAQTFTVVEK